MNSHLFFVICAGIMISAPLPCACMGEVKVLVGEKTSRERKPSVVVRLEKDNDVQSLRDGRTSLIYDCIRVLNDTAAPASRKTQEQKESALHLLGTLRASDHHEALELLAKNVSFPAGVFFGDPLSGFPAARAIVEIGSPALRELLHIVERERTNHELRLVAFIIKRVDGRELGLCRIELEIKRVLENQPDLREEPNAHVKNLRKLRTWFSDAEFFKKRDNWP